MADLYSGERSSHGGNSDAAAPGEAYAPSEPGDVGEQGSRGVGGVFRTDQRARVIGNKFDTPKSGLFTYDVIHGRLGDLQFSVSRDDRMSPHEAGEKLRLLHEYFGVASESDEILYGFDRALMFCHTLNSGSILVPGRAKFSLPGAKAEFDFSKVRNFLDADMRRFFRAYADFTMTVNKQVLEAYARNPHNEHVQENFGLLKAVAADRNLHRYPYLAHDSADACLELNLSERMAVNASKAAVVSAGPNAVDGTKPKFAIKSADGLNSTNGERY